MDTVIMNKGDVGDAMYFLVEGTAAANIENMVGGVHSARGGRGVSACTWLRAHAPAG